MFGGIWEELVTKLVHRAYSGVRPSAINTPGSTRIASCAPLCGAFTAIVRVVEGDVIDMRGDTTLYDVQKIYN